MVTFIYKKETDKRKIFNVFVYVPACSSKYMLKYKKIYWICQSLCFVSLKKKNDTNSNEILKSCRSIRINGSKYWKNIHETVLGKWNDGYYERTIRSFSPTMLKFLTASFLKIYLSVWTTGVILLIYSKCLSRQLISLS